MTETPHARAAKAGGERFDATPLVIVIVYAVADQHVLNVNPDASP